MMLLSELASIGTDISGFSITASLIYVAKQTKPDLNRSSAPQVKDHVVQEAREPSPRQLGVGSVAQPLALDTFDVVPEARDRASIASHPAWFTVFTVTQRELDSKSQMRESCTSGSVGAPAE